MEKACRHEPKYFIDSSGLSHTLERLRSEQSVTKHVREIVDALCTMYEDLERFRVPYKLWIRQKVITIQPIGFSIPEQFVQRKVPAKTKAFSTVLPGRKATYIYRPSGNIHEDARLQHLYHRDMQESLFCLTYKKSGWDCLRHLEIMSAGCIPVFTDIQRSPPKSLIAYPKALLSALHHFPGLNVTGVTKRDDFHFDFDWNKLDQLLYSLVVQSILSYTHNELTTHAMASYLLSCVGFKPKKILFIGSNARKRGDYMADTLLHGLLSVLGRYAIVDYPRRGVLYMTPRTLNTSIYIEQKLRSYGNGFHWAGEVFEFPGTVDRSNIPQRLSDQEFDLVIFGQAHRFESGMAFFKEICRSIDPQRVVAIHGGDRPPNIEFFDYFLPCSKQIFSREQVTL